MQKSRIGQTWSTRGRRDERQRKDQGRERSGIITQGPILHSMWHAWSDSTLKSLWPSLLPSGPLPNLTVCFWGRSAPPTESFAFTSVSVLSPHTQGQGIGLIWNVALRNAGEEKGAGEAGRIREGVLMSRLVLRAWVPLSVVSPECRRPRPSSTTANSFLDILERTMPLRRLTPESPTSAVRAPNTPTYTVCEHWADVPTVSGHLCRPRQIPRFDAESASSHQVA